MARIPYEDEIIISWVELHRDARYLSEVLHAKGPWRGIIAVTRGGLVPAALVARELDIRLVDTICVTSYDSGAAGGAAQVQSDVQVLKGVQHLREVAGVAVQLHPRDDDLVFIRDACHAEF